MDGVGELGGVCEGCSCISVMEEDMICGMLVTAPRGGGNNQGGTNREDTIEYRGWVPTQLGGTGSSPIGVWGSAPEALQDSISKPSSVL